MTNDVSFCFQQEACVLTPSFFQTASKVRCAWALAVLHVAIGGTDCEVTAPRDCQLVDPTDSKWRNGKLSFRPARNTSGKKRLGISAIENIEIYSNDIDKVILSVN